MSINSRVGDNLVTYSQVFPTPWPFPWNLEGSVSASQSWQLVKLVFRQSIWNGSDKRTARIDAEDTDALAIQLFTKPFGEHGARGIGLTVRGPWLICLSVLWKAQIFNMLSDTGNIAPDLRWNRGRQSEPCLVSSQRSK